MLKGKTMISLKKFQNHWYKAHVSHNPDFERDVKSKAWRGSVITAQTWQQVLDRTKGKWNVAACNRCLPHQL